MKKTLYLILSLAFLFFIYGCQTYSKRGEPTYHPGHPGHEYHY